MKDLTTGPIRGHLLRTGAFMLASMFVQTAYSLIDLYWVGRLGKDAVAAVTISNNLMLAVLALTQILAVGSGALVAQAMGRKDRAEVRLLFNQSLLLALLLGGAFTAIMLPLREQYSLLLAGDANTAQLAIRFLTFFVPALGLQFPLMTMSAALRGAGDMRTAVVTQAATLILNIVLAPVLIFGWLTGVPLGVTGAALATLAALVIGIGGLFFHIVRKGHHFDPQPSSWRPRLPLWTRLANIGLPSGAEFALLALYLSFVMWVIRPFGASAQAAFGIGQRWLQAGMMPPMAISLAASAIVGQNFGAGQFARVRQAFAQSLLGCMFAAGIFFTLFQAMPHLLFRPFTQDPPVFAFGEEYLGIISWNLMATGVVFACFGVFSGLGNTVPCLLGSAVRITLIAVPVWLLSRHSGFRARWVWELSAAATVVQMLINLWFLRREYSTRLAVLPPENEGLIVAADTGPETA
jgi:putative MATE family efflux protein